VTGVGEKTAGRMVLGGGAENRAHACSIQSVGVGLLEERRGEESNQAVQFAVQFRRFLVWPDWGGERRRNLLQSNMRNLILGRWSRH